MAQLKFRKHPNGPELPEVFKGKVFGSFSAMADFADENVLPPGLYWIRNPHGSNLATAIRELRYRMESGGFWVEGKENY